MFFFLKVFLYLQNMWFSIVEFVRNFKYICVCFVSRCPRDFCIGCVMLEVSLW